MRWAWVCWDPLCSGPLGPLARTLVARPGGGGTDGPCAWGTDGLCDWGTDGLCAGVTNDLGTDVLASAAAPSGGGAGLGRERYPDGRCGAVEDAWLSVGRRPASLGVGWPPRTR